MSGIHSHDRNIILKYCVENNITVFVVPRIGDTIMSGAHHMHMFHLPMLRVGRYNPQPEYLFVKRLLDIVISAIALVILSPIFLVTAISIKATDHGPVFYKQIRLTKDGKEFGILKFRSMRVDAEKDGVARLSSGENDDRITPIGKIIRACRVDELPQLINILKGDLSIVGPRPERPEIAVQYCEEMTDPWQHRHELAQNYLQEHGDLLIPAKYKTDDGIWLGRWLYEQKVLLRKQSPKLNADKIDKLRKLLGEEPTEKVG